MPANEFEKQVQKQLDDFQLKPSASVWKKVEEQIRQKKRRRIIFFFLLPVVAGLLTYTAYYFLLTGQKTGLPKQAVVEKSERSLTTDKDNTPPTTGQQPAILPSYGNDKGSKPGKKETIQKQQADNIQKVQTPIPSDNVPPARRTNKTKKQDDQIAKVMVKSGASLIDNSAPEKKDVPAGSDKTKKAIIKKDPIERPAKTNDPTDGPGIDPKDSVFAKKAIATDQIQNQTSKTDVPIDALVGNPTKPVPEKTDSFKTEDLIKTGNKETKKETVGKKTVTRPKIKWGIDLSTGITSSQTSLFSLNKSYNAVNVAYNSPAAAVGSYPGRSLTLPPSSAKAGPAFRVGVFGEFQLSKRSCISLGLQYAYASNRIKTGTAIANDTVLLSPSINNFVPGIVDQVYRGPQQNSYINSYHFVSMPIEYHWQINKSKKLPVQWSVGIAPGYLLATDALVYSSSFGGIYYYDQKAINRFHLSAGTGLSVRLTGKKGMAYRLGPELSFDTRKLNNNSYQKSQHFVYWGLRARLLLPGRKNK